MPKKSKKDQKKEMCLKLCEEYINEKNRPFSHINISDALGKEYGTTVVKRSLAQLADEGRIHSKQYKKQTIYAAIQDQFEQFTDDQLFEMDQRIKALEEEEEELAAQVKELTATNNQIRAQPTNASIAEDLEQLPTVLEAKKAELAALTGSGVEVFTEEQMLAKEKKLRDLAKKWKKRKRVVKEAALLLGDNTGVKPAALYEELGVETDEEVGVDIATISIPEARRPTKRQRPL